MGDKKITIDPEEFNADGLPERLRGDYELLKEVIKRHPRIANAEDWEVFMKIAVIDSTNSTHLSTAKDKISLKELAEIIKSIKGIDERIENGDPGVVEEIVSKAKYEYDYNPFSFATKFCCYHNRFAYGKDDYSIYDSRVQKNLPDYEGCTDDEGRTVTKNRLDRWRKEGKYKEFNDCVWSVLREKGLDGEEFPRKKHFRAAICSEYAQETAGGKNKPRVARRNGWRKLRRREDDPTASGT